MVAACDSDRRDLLGVTICHFGSFDPDAPRNLQMQRALLSAGANVVTIANGSRASLFKQTRSLSPDIVLVGWPGSSWVPLAKAAARRGTPVVLDQLTSPWETSVVDRAVVPRRSTRAAYLWLKEATALRLADLVVVDTDENAAFLSNEYGIRRDKFSTIWVGADESVWSKCDDRSATSEFVVLHLASYIPLHGMEIVIEAAALVARTDPTIRFVLVGDGQTFLGVSARAQELALQNVEFRPWLEKADARDACCGADLCLGVFGVTPKAARVIPNKLYNALSMGRPVLTGDSPALREALVPGVDVLTSRLGDPASLAAAVLWAREHPEQLEQIAAAGHSRFEEKFQTRVLGELLAATLIRTRRSVPGNADQQT